MIGITFTMKLSAKDYRLFERGVIALEKIAAKYCNPKKPSSFTISVTEQIVVGDKTMLKFAVGLEAVDPNDPNAGDVDHRTLTVTIDGGAPIVTTVTDLGDSVQNDAGYVANAGSVVSASLVDSDASGNNSPARTETATLTDTIAPPQPGEFVIGVVSQT